MQTENTQAKWRGWSAQGNLRTSLWKRGVKQSKSPGFEFLGSETKPETPSTAIAAMTSHFGNISFQTETALNSCLRNRTTPL